MALTNNRSALLNSKAPYSTQEHAPQMYSNLTNVTYVYSMYMYEWHNMYFPEPEARKLGKKEFMLLNR